MVIVLTVSSGHDGSYMLRPWLVASNIAPVLRLTSASATFGYSGTFTSDGNGLRLHSESTL